MARPRIDVNWHMVAELAGLRFTMEDACRITGYSWDTLTRHCIEDNGIPFADFFDAAKIKGDMSIRRKQYEMALAGNVPLLIHLGKQGGQTDKVETTANVNVRGPVDLTQDDFQAIAIEYKKLDDEI